MGEMISYGDEYLRLKRLSREELVELVLLQVRNIWRVDGLYFQGIEKRFGVDEAMDIDRDVWRVLARIEARDLMKTFRIQGVKDIGEFISLLEKTSWSLYQDIKSIEVDGDTAIFKVVKCRIQEARIRKGLGVFPCKPVRYGYLEEFAKTLNPDIVVEAISVPPERSTDEYWCGWRFRIRGGTR